MPDCLIVSFELASAESVPAVGRTVTVLSPLDEGRVTASLRRGQRILQDMQAKEYYTQFKDQRRCG